MFLCHINLSLSLSLSPLPLPISLKSINISLGGDYKKIIPFKSGIVTIACNECQVQADS